MLLSLERYASYTYRLKKISFAGTTTSFLTLHIKISKKTIDTEARMIHLRTCFINQLFTEKTHS